MRSKLGKDWKDASVLLLNQRERKKNHLHTRISKLVCLLGSRIKRPPEMLEDKMKIKGLIPLVYLRVGGTEVENRWKGLSLRHEKALFTG